MPSRLKSVSTSRESLQALVKLLLTVLTPEELKVYRHNAQSHKGGPRFQHPIEEIAQ